MPVKVAREVPSWLGSTAKLHSLCIVATEDATRLVDAAERKR